MEGLRFINFREDILMVTCRALSTGGLGRFGNQCFSLASSIGIATKNNQPYAFDRWINQDNALFGGNPDDMGQFFANPLPQLPEGLSFTDIPYHWEFKDYNIPDGNWNICSHLQDQRYFEHCMPLIRETFRMKDEMDKWKDYTVLHWRAGDYEESQTAYHPRLPIEYYKKAIDILPSDSKFLCFSDDIDRFSDMIIAEYGHDYEGKRFRYVNGDYITSFKMMKGCKNFVTANSSYSFFAALLGEHPEKKIIMPNIWFGSNAGDMRLEYPETAIVI